MIAEIVIIPDGMGLDAAKAGARYAARGLSSLGMKVREHISVCPDSEQFQKAVAVALARSNILLTIGGMGPESDYMAKTVLSKGLRLPLEENAEALLGLREFCRKTGNPYLAEDSALVMLPQGAAVFPGSFSKLPGCAISSEKQHIIMLPETQAEIAPMFNRHAAPYLGGAPSVTVTRTLRTYGVNESGVTSVLSDLTEDANPAVTVQKDGNEVLVRVSAHAPASQQAAALCTPVLKDIVDRLGDSAYGLDVDSIQTAVILKLRKKELDIAVAEGGTFGMLARIISETPGGQEFLRYSAVIDQISAKTKMLGLSKKELKKSGNVSEYAAVASAVAVREKSGASFGVSVLANTGLEKRRDCPLGVVYVAVSNADNVYVKKLIIGDGKADPDLITDAAISRALNMTRLMIDYYPGSYSSAIPLEAALLGESVTDLIDYEDVEIADIKGEKKALKGFKRLLDNLRIHKTDKRGVKVRKFVFFLAILVFLGSAGYVGYHYYSGYIAKKQAAELQNMFLYGDMDNVEVSPDYPRDYSLKFAGLWNVNSDVAAYLSIPDTGVNYPIVKAKDNDYYLRRDFYGNPNQYGIPFMDYRVDVERPSDNIVVYGHNMKDGQIFGELIQYSPKSSSQNGSISYYKEHPVIDFTTVYKEGKYKIFSVFITNAYENQGPVFAYHDFIDAAGSSDLERYLSEVRKRSMINTTVDVREGDEILTLSTCTYEFKDARLVIVARAVRRGEGEAVDVDGAALNPSPLMPDIWYQTFGGSKPVGESVPEIATEAAASPPSSGLSQSLQPLSSGGGASVSSLPGALSSSRASSGMTAEEEALASAAESRAAERREESRLAEQSRRDEESRLLEESRLAEERALSEASEEASRLEEESESQPDDDNILGDGLDSDMLAMIKTPELTGLTYAKKKASNADEFGITIKENGRTLTDSLDIISRLVQNEMGSKFEEEAIKAQAVAAYTFIAHSNISGNSPQIYLAPKADERIVDAVSEVLGEMILYKNKVAFTPYHATSAGKTTSSKAVWGGGYPYLVSVDSSVDKKAPNFKVITKMSRDEVSERIYDNLGIEAEGNPAKWFKVLNTYNGYNYEMSVCGETKNALNGNKITGRMVRENVLNLRSAYFKVSYDDELEEFSFTTYGYGHGVGMSQTGANFYAQKGWSYKKILKHYYPGTTVKTADEI